MTLRILTASPSITQAIKHIHIEIKCKHKFGFNLIEIRQSSVSVSASGALRAQGTASIYLAIRNALSAERSRGN